MSTFAQVPTCLAWTRAEPSSTCQVRDPWHRIPLPITPCCHTSCDYHTFSSSHITRVRRLTVVHAFRFTSCDVNTQLRVNSFLSACSSNSQCFRPLLSVTTYMTCLTSCCQSISSFLCFFLNLQSFVSLNVVSWNIYEEIQLVGLVITETVEHKI